MRRSFSSFFQSELYGSTAKRSSPVPRDGLHESQASPTPSFRIFVVVGRVVVVGLDELEERELGRSGISMSLPARSITQPGRTNTLLRSASSQIDLEAGDDSPAVQVRVVVLEAVARAQHVERLLHRLGRRSVGCGQRARSVREADVLGLERRKGGELDAAVLDLDGRPVARRNPT